jgi:integrase/endogenous inhibitor of DNA gyrase (YacG/DUF329 family)
MNAIPPHEAKNRYLKDKSTDVTDSTLSNYRTTLDGFCNWLCNEAGVKTLNTLTSDEIQQFKEWRLERVKTITLKTDMTCIKGFIQFCEHINAVPDGMHQLVRVPKPNREDEVADSILTSDEATEILAYLDKHEYASLRHVVFSVLWKTGMRRSSLYGLDKRDFEDGANPYLRVRHRPESGTPLKNKSRGERDVRITDEVANVLREVPKSKGGNHQISNLVTVCKNCHNAIHGNSTVKKNKHNSTPQTNFSKSDDRSISAYQTKRSKSENDSESTSQSDSPVSNSKRKKIRKQKKKLERIKERNNPSDGLSWNNYADSRHKVPCPFCGVEIRNRERNFVAHLAKTKEPSDLPTSSPQNLIISEEGWENILNKIVEEHQTESDSDENSNAEATFPWLNYPEDEWRVPCPTCDKMIHNARGSFLTHWKESTFCSGPPRKIYQQYDVKLKELEMDNGLLSRFWFALSRICMSWF